MFFDVFWCFINIDLDWLFPVDYPCWCFSFTCFSGYVVWYARDHRQNRIRTLIGCFHRRVDDRDLTIAIQVFLYDIFSSPVILFLKLTGYIKLEVI